MPEEGNTEKPDLALIDAALGRKGFDLRFPDPLEYQFDRDTGPARSRMYVRMQVLSLVLFNAFLLIDYISLPDVFRLAVALRLGLGTGLTLAALWITARNPPGPVRDGLAVAVAIVMAAVIWVLVASSSSPLRENYHFGIVFIMLFTVLVLRLRFVSAVVTVLALMAIEAMAALSVNDATMQDKSASLMLTMAPGGFALIAAYTIDKAERQSWLQSWHDRLRASALEKLAEIDPLTGLGNRRAMQQWIGEQCLSAQGRMASLLIVDIDNFKHYNDTFGHIAGDDCIRRVCAMLSADARKTNDRVFRFGGEEFIVLLVGLDLLAGVTVAERMRRTIAAQRIPHNVPRGPDHVTASFGVAARELAPDLDLNAFIEEADRALYEAKSTGRNRVVPPLLTIADEQRTHG